MPFLIPDTIDPEETICVMLHVPDDPAHIDAFWGALDVLGHYWNWEKDEAHSAADLSRVWQEVIKAAHANMGDCLVHVHYLRQTDCTIELLIDGVLQTSFKLDAEECGLLNAGGEGTKIIAPGEVEEDRKTALFSGAMALVIYCQEAVIDAFNAIEAEIEIGKAATVWMETVPGLDLSPAHEVLMACDDFNEMLESVFEATDTPEWREDMSCKIMCWCVANNYTFDKTIVDEWREYLTDMGIAAPDYFYSNFVDVASYKALIDRFSLGMNDENEDWLILCDECEASGICTFDDILTDLPFTFEWGEEGIDGNPDDCAHATEYVSGAPWIYGLQYIVRFELPEPLSVARARWDYYVERASGPGGEVGWSVRFLDDEEEQIAHWTSHEHPPNEEWVDFSVSEGTVDDVSYIEIRNWMVEANPQLGNKLYMDNFRFYSS